MCIGTETNCPICGTVIIQSGKGKPREYCTDNCRDIFKYMNALERNLLKVDFESSENASTLKGAFFRMSNLIKIRKD